MTRNRISVAALAAGGLVTGSLLFAGPAAARSGGGYGDGSGGGISGTPSVVRDSLIPNYSPDHMNDFTSVSDQGIGGGHPGGGGSDAGEPRVVAAST